MATEERDGLPWSKEDGTAVMETRGKGIIMLEQKAEITQALQAILKKSGKDFLSLSIVKTKMGSGMRRALEIKSNHSSASVRKILEAYLGETLEILKGGRSVYLAIRRAPVDWVLMGLSTHAPKGVGALGKLLPIFSKTRLIGVLNELLRDRRVVASLNEKGEARLTISSNAMEVPPAPPESDNGCEPINAGRPETAIIDSLDEKARRKAFYLAFRELDRGRIFVRICDLRRHLGWKREDFDSLLRHLRDEEIIQLHSGDVTMMTSQEVDEGFIDENGFRMGTVTWHGRD